MPLSEDNVERHRELVNAFNAHDIEAFVAHFGVHGEFESVFSAVGGASYRGHDELMSYFRDLLEAWDDDLRLAPNAYFACREHTLLDHVIHARGRQSGAAVTMPVTHAISWREGLIIRMKTCASMDEALATLGLSADELEPVSNRGSA